MQPALGDRLFDFVIFAFFACWAIGWLILLTVMGLQYLLPTREAGLEHALQVTGNVLGPVLKYTLWAGGILLAIRVVASWLGWAPPIPPGDPGD